jgi:hypothetical protein
MTRIPLRTAFLALDRRPLVHFYTTSTDKFLQARYVFERSGLALKLFKSKRDPYGENEEGTSEELLASAIAEIRATLGQSSLFFVEDTSVVIDALSRSGQPFPGLHVKDWFASTTFEALDRELRGAGNDRRASVRSDIGLHVPGLDRPVYFAAKRSAPSPASRQTSIRSPGTRGSRRTASMAGSSPMAPPGHWARCQLTSRFSTTSGSGRYWRC